MWALGPKKTFGPLVDRIILHNVTYHNVEMADHDSKMKMMMMMSQLKLKNYLSKHTLKC